MPTVAVNGVTLEYLEQGDGRAKVLFCHGFVSSAGYWKEVLPLLPRSLHAYAVSLRGHAGSTAGRNPVSIKLFTDDLAAMVRALNLAPVAFVGHSMGGAIGMQLALDYPDLLGCLVLVAPVPAHGLAIPPEVVDIMRAAINARSFKETLLSTLASPPSPERLQEFLDDAARVSPKQNLEEMDAFRFFNQAARIGSIRVPTLVIAGEKDIQCPAAEVQRTAEGIPGARYLLIGGAAHMIHMLDPRLFTGLVSSFITSSMPRRRAAA